MDSKICKGCKEEKSIEDFHFADKKTGKRKPKCKVCQAAYFKQYTEQNANRLRQKWRIASKAYHSTDKRRLRTLKKYGLTLETYNKMYDKQDGKCAICTRDLRLVVDHCHDSLVVRGLLCNGCNLGIGYFEDDVDRMKSAIKYIAGKRNGNSRLS